MATTLKWMQQKLGLIACFGALVCAAPASTTVPRQTNTKTDPYQKLTVAIFPGGFNWPLWVIKEHGIDNSLGLNIEIVGIRNSEDQMKGLQDGRFDIVMTGFDNVIAYGGGGYEPQSTLN